MWRAWGIFLLLLSPQDLGSRAIAPDHEMAIRPPAGWIRRVGAGPTLVKYTQPGELKLPSELMITHLVTTNPTPLESFKKQARENIQEKFPGSKVLEEKDLTIGGRPAFRMVFSEKELVSLKTIVHRTNLEFYLLDATYAPDQADKVRPLLEASIATLEIIPLPMNAEEKLSFARTLELLRSAKVDPGLLGERWFSIHLGQKKVGHIRMKLSDSGGNYAFEEDVKSDFGEGNTDTTVLRGAYSPDGRFQKLETEQTKVNPKQKWVFRATGLVQNGQAKVSRDLNGVKEERSFPVEEGVLFSDLAEFERAAIIGAGRGSYLIKTLSPFVEEWGVEAIEVGGAESLDVDGKVRACVLVQSYVGRRKSMTYFFAPDRTLLHVGGPRDLFSVRAATQEEALKK